MLCAAIIINTIPQILIYEISAPYILVHKQMYWILTNLLQPSNVKCNIGNVYIMEYVGNFCVVLVPYMSSQKGEFIFLGNY